MGFRADMIRFPEQRFSVICLANLSSVNPSQLARRVADIYLEDEMEPVPEREVEDRRRPPEREREAREPLTLTGELISQYSGSYYSEELDVVYELVPGEGELFLKIAGRGNLRLELRSEDVLRSGGLTFNFFMDPEGGVAGFRLDAGRVRNLRFDYRKEEPGI